MHLIACKTLILYDVAHLVINLKHAIKLHCRKTCKMKDGYITNSREKCIGYTCIPISWNPNYICVFKLVFILHCNLPLLHVLVLFIKKCLPYNVKKGTLFV